MKLTDHSNWTKKWSVKNVKQWAKTFLTVGGRYVIRHNNKVTLRWAWLVLGWVTIFRWRHHLSM